ncbi:hypothetical protein ACGGZK_15410 [Agromyces sp. MMS24-K17]|uniref:hypothetical protein n=1 Tax=Agromyces sp. MMS24-K17 TaxID=3372850 RepID=UPI0037546FF2
MKTFLGFLQVGSGIGGLIALFNGQWGLTILAWGFALLIGYLGNRMVRAVEGVSQTGREALGGVSQSIDLLRRGEYRSALGVSRSTVSSFRMGGDKAFLPIALTIHAVALGATGDVQGARRAAQEADDGFRRLPPMLAADADEMREVLAVVRRELDRGVPDPSGLVEKFLAFNDA